MLCSLDCVQHFEIIVRIMKAKKCLEIGTYTGYTTLSLAKAMPDEGKIVTLDVTDKYVAFDLWERAKVDHKVSRFL
jgi:predicted O-methyltransferase YrrM